MKAKCINDRSEEHPNYLSKLISNKLSGLTKDKLYEAEQAKEYEGYFEVLNDLGIKESYKKERFEIMECINKECGFNIDNECHHNVISNTCIECDKRTKPQHTPSYAEEQLEYAKEKENKCYNEKCNQNDKNGKCQMEGQYYIDNCTSRDMEQPIPINYEEEYKKQLKDEDKKYIEGIKVFNRCLKKSEEENRKLENTRDALVKANNELKNENEELSKTNVDLQEYNLKYFNDAKELRRENENLIKEKELLEHQLENELSRNHVVMKKNEELRAENKRLMELPIKNEENNKELTVIVAEQNEEINQLREEIQQSNFKLKEYESKLPQLKELVVKLIRINELLASNIYVEGLDD